MSTPDTTALERADRLINAMCPYIGQMALPAEIFADLNEHGIHMQRRQMEMACGTATPIKAYVEAEHAWRTACQALVDATTRLYPVGSRWWVTRGNGRFRIRVEGHGHWWSRPKMVRARNLNTGNIHWFDMEDPAPLD